MNTTNAKARGASPANTLDPVQAYLREIGRIPLLSHEQEIIYGRQVWQMMQILEHKARLAAQFQRQPTSQEWAESVHLSESDLEKVLHDGQQAKRKMIEANLRLVVAVAKKYQQRHLDLLDLIQEGSLGLERGVEKFNPARGYKFSTYAFWWIRQGITRAIAQQSRTIRLPIHITEALNKIKKSHRVLAQQLGRRATIAEIGAALGLESSRVREYLALTRQPLSLELRVGDEQDTELKDLIEASSPAPEVHVTQNLLRQDVATLLSDLTSLERQVLLLRYGFEDGKNLSLAEVAARLKISRERVRQIQDRALHRLRLHEKGMRDYLAG